MKENVESKKADIFMRHGSFEKPKFSTYHNFQLFITGIDFPLNVMGKNEIKESLDKITDSSSIDLIVSSPYRRAYESAQIAQKYLKEHYRNNIPIQLSDFLQEIEVGKEVLSRWEFYVLFLRSCGRMRTLKEAVLEAVFDKWRFGKAKEKPIETEERIKKLLYEIHQLHERGYKRLLFVSHASFGRVLKRFLTERKITLSRKEDKPLKRGGLFYILRTSSGNNFKIIEPEV